MAVADGQQLQGLGHDDSAEDLNLGGKKDTKEGGGTGDLMTYPNKKLTYNAPFSHNNSHYMKLLNNSWHKIGWRQVRRELNMAELLCQDMEPRCGVLDPNESVFTKVTCLQQDFFDDDDESGTRITLEWTNTPPNAGAEYKDEWFVKSKAEIKDKQIQLEFNK